MLLHGGLNIGKDKMGLPEPQMPLRGHEQFSEEVQNTFWKKKKSATKKLRPFLEPNPNQTFLKVITCSEVSFHYFSLIQSSALPELS